MIRSNNEKLNRDNRGMTLVEVIVSLLILMIIVVPLLSGFVSVLKTNKKSKDIIYAHTVGENVMEAVKVLGLEETAREFSNCGLRDTFSVVPDGIADDYYEVDVAGNKCNRSIITSDGKKYFKPIEGIDTYEYRIDGVQEGTDKYDIDISISTINDYSDTDGPNTYQYADLSAFSSDSVAVINPVIQGTSYDSRALSYFSNMNRRIVYDRYAKACREVNEINKERMDQYEAERAAGGNPEPPYLEPRPPKTNYVPLTPAEVSECIRKKVVVTVQEETVDGNTQYVLNSEMQYSCINKGDSNNKPLFSTDTVTYPVDDDSKPIMLDAYNGYCKDLKYTSLDTIMLIYTPINTIDKLNNETIEFVKEPANAMDLYIVFQGSEDYESISNKPNLKINGNSINLYSQIDFGGVTIDGIHSDLNISQKLISDLPAGNRLYNISVKVYESGSSYSKLVSQIDSTMLDD